MINCDNCIVKKMNSLRSLTEAELDKISNSKTSKSVHKGETIFKEGELLNGVYCVREGICKLTKLSANGKDQVVKLVVKGELLGQRSIISNESTNLSATALNDMELCFIPKKEILKNLHKNPNFSFSVLQQMASDLKDADDVIVNMAQKTVRQRLAQALIYLHTHFGISLDGALSVVISREEYASLIGTATESTIRVLSQFKKEGLISTSGKHIKIENLEELERVK